MTDEEKLTTLKMLVGGKDSDVVLSYYLNRAKEKILSIAYHFKEDKTGLEVPAQYDYLQITMAEYLMNKRGAEGQTAHSENGISRSYENADFPASMLRQITPYCEVPE